MSINHIVKIIALQLALLGSNCSAQQSVQAIHHNDCATIHSGQTDYQTISNEDAATNSAFFDCAIGVRISEPDSMGHRTQKVETWKIADHFLVKLDPTYRDEHGNTLLSILVISFTPTEWKIATAKKLVEFGVDISAKNRFGKTALDLANSGNEPELAALLKSQLPSE